MNLRSQNATTTRVIHDSSNCTSGTTHVTAIPLLPQRLRYCLSARYARGLKASEGTSYVPCIPSIRPTLRSRKDIPKKPDKRNKRITIKETRAKEIRAKEIRGKKSGQKK